MYKISKINAFSFENVLRWSMYSILNYISVILLIFLYVKINNLGKFQLRDRFNIIDSVWLRIVDLLIIAPLLETAAILCLIYFSKKYSNSKILNYAVISILFGLLHLLSGPISLAILVTATFQAQMLYLFIRQNHINFRTAWFEGVLIHSIHNSFIFMVSYFKILH